MSAVMSLIGPGLSEPTGWAVVTEGEGLAARRQAGRLRWGERPRRGLSLYGETLGLVLKDARPFVLVHQTAESQLRITLVDTVIAAPYTALGWAVADLDCEVDRLVAAGVVFNRYVDMDQNDRGIWTAPGSRIAWFHDPDGNTLSLQG